MLERLVLFKELHKVRTRTLFEIKVKKIDFINAEQFLENAHSILNTQSVGK